MLTQEEVNSVITRKAFIIEIETLLDDFLETQDHLIFEAVF
jgi:hypothetical protein